MSTPEEDKWGITAGSAATRITLRIVPKGTATVEDREDLRGWFMAYAPLFSDLADSMVGISDAVVMLLTVGVSREMIPVKSTAIAELLGRLKAARIEVMDLCMALAPEKNRPQ